MRLQKEQEYAAEISKLEKQRDEAIESERARMQHQVVIDRTPLHLADFF